MNFCDGDHPKCMYEKMKTLSTETILTLRDTCKTVVNERYSESTKKPTRKVVICSECNGSGISHSEKSTSLEFCDKGLVDRLINRIEIEHRKRRLREITLGFSCIDTGKTIYVGSDECHGCKCYGGSNGQKVTCKLHKLDK